MRSLHLFLQPRSNYQYQYELHMQNQLLSSLLVTLEFFPEEYTRKPLLETNQL